MNTKTGRATEGLAEMPTDQLERELILLGTELRRRTADLLLLVGEFDHRGSWALFGSLSCAAWLADACDIDIATARTQVRVARAMREHEALAEAVVDGRVSYAKARVLVPYLTHENVEDLLGLAERHSANDLGLAIAAWSRRFEGEEERDERHRRERRLSWRTDGDGMICFAIRLPPAEAGMLIAAIDHSVMGASTAGDSRPPADPMGAHTAAGANPKRNSTDAPPGALKEGEVERAVGHVGSASAGAADPDRAGRRRGDERDPVDGDARRVPWIRSENAPAGATLAQQRADALVDIATTRTITNLGAESGGDRTEAVERAGQDGSPERDGTTVTAEMVIHVRGDGNTLADGTPISDHAVAGLLPGAFVSLLVEDMRRRPIDASPRRRTPTRRQRRVVDERYPTCAHPGCNARVFLQYDHVRPYAQGGPTTIDNLRRLCGPHNRARNAGLRSDGSSPS